MKFKTTKKEIMGNYSTVLCIRYCNLHFLLNYENPVAYTSGVYGWNADIYDMGNGKVIVTGNRPFGKKVKYETVKKYNDLAYDIVYAQNEIPMLSYEDQKHELDKLIKEFIEEAIKEEN